MTTIIETERLILRTWNQEDARSYFQINQDPKVIEFLRGPLTMEPHFPENCTYAAP